MDSLHALDFRILDALQEALRCDFLDAAMTIISWLGGGIIWGVFGVLFLFWKSTRRNGAFILASLISATLIVEFLIKPIFLRERPFMLNPEHALIVSPPFGTSFPSGHTTTSFAAAVQFFRINKPCGIAACAFAALVAFSRLYLYVHFPSDVLVGCILGIFIGLICTKTGELILQKIKKNKNE